MLQQIAARRNQLILIFLLFAAQAALNLHMWSVDPTWVAPPAVEERKPDPRIVKFLSFGNWPVGVDWLWMKALQEQSTAHVAPGTHAGSYYNLDLATDLDPAFFEAYAYGANYLAVVRNDIPGARDLLLKGDRFRKADLPGFPDEVKSHFWAGEWSIPMILAYVYLFELDDISTAGKYFKEAGEVAGAPTYLVDLGKRFEYPGGEYEVGLRLLKFMLSSQSDPAAKEKLEEKRKSLFVSQFLYYLEQDFQKFLNDDPGYRVRHSLPRKKMQNYWRQFLRKTHNADRDPFGGKVYLSAEGRLQTTTPRERVFGLE